MKVSINENSNDSLVLQLKVSFMDNKTAAQVTSFTQD